MRQAPILWPPSVHVNLALSARSLPAPIPQAALLGNSDARAELAKEVEVKMLILTSLQLLVPGASDAEYKQVEGGGRKAGEN